MSKPYPIDDPAERFHDDFAKGKTRPGGKTTPAPAKGDSPIPGSSDRSAESLTDRRELDAE